MPWLCSQPTPSYIARNSLAFSCFPEFLNVSYFYERAQSHETIVDCDIDSISVSGQLPIYPSPNPILTLTCYQLAVVECGGGGVYERNEKPFGVISALQKSCTFQILINARWRMEKLLILSVVCGVGCAKDRRSPSYIARNSFVFSCMKFLRVSYFYERAQTHEAIVDCEKNLDSCTNGFYFPEFSTFLIRSDVPSGAPETLWRFPP